MSVFTAKRRAQIYRTVAVDMEKDEWRSEYYICNILTRYTGSNLGNISLPIEILDEFFPELILFRPDYTSRLTPWWPDNDKESRIMALLFMAEIAENL